MLRLAFDFIIAWREIRARPNAYARMHTILEHFRSALCNLKKGGIDLSLNKWVELVSLCTTDFSLTGIFLLFPFSPLHARV